MVEMILSLTLRSAHPSLWAAWHDVLGSASYVEGATVSVDEGTRVGYVTMIGSPIDCDNVARGVGMWADRLPHAFTFSDVRMPI